MLPSRSPPASSPINLLKGDGSQTRSFQYVDDLVRGLIALMNSSYDQPVNIGNPDEYTVKDFAQVCFRSKVRPFIHLFSFVSSFVRQFVRSFVPFVLCLVVSAKTIPH